MWRTVDKRSKKRHKKNKKRKQKIKEGIPEVVLKIKEIYTNVGKDEKIKTEKERGERIHGEN